MRRPFLKAAQPQEFWITNISKQAIALSDLGIDVLPMTSINLLSNGYNITLEQAERSKAEGSIFKRSHSIIHRKVPPQAARKLTAFNPTEPIFNPNGSAIQSRAHSTVKVEDPHYEELSITDEQYAENEVATETTPEKGSKTVIKSK
jgi:hypothetical protein